MDKEKYISKIKNLQDHLSYNPQKKRLILETKDFDEKFINNLFSKVIPFLKSNLPPKGVFEYPKVSTMKFDHHGEAFINYPHQILDQKILHKDTEWARRFEKITHITYSNKKNQNLRELVINKLYSNKKISKRFIKKIENGHGNIVSSNGWIQFVDINYNELTKNNYQYYIWLIKKSFSPEDRLISQVKKMMKEGFDVKKAYSTEIKGIRNLNGLLFYSTLQKKYSFISGKHRFASLKYLVSKNKESKDIEIKFPVIEHNFTHWRSYFYNNIKE